VLAAMAGGSLTPVRFESQICVAIIGFGAKLRDFLSGRGVMMAGLDHSISPHKLGNGKYAVPNSEERLQAVLAKLEECQAALVSGGDRDTAQLLSLAILELRIKLNRIEDSELKALCEAMLRDAEAADRPAMAKTLEVPPRRSPVTLKLVK
jgi:hypothetical protein